LGNKRVASNFMDEITDILHITKNYNKGYRYFINLDFDKGERLTGEILAESIFENCCFSADFSMTNFSNSIFIGCNLKCSDFSNCDLTNTLFENCSLEETLFKSATVDNMTIENCFCYGNKVLMNHETRELASVKTKLVDELYRNVPEFDRKADHSNDELENVVFGELSLMLFENITSNNQTTEFAKKCFAFFNLIGSRNEDGIDNLLIVGVYEGLYGNKKCNDIAKELLTGRNKEIYEYWMINGNIRTEY